MKLTTMATLESQKAELQKSKTLTIAEREECLRLNAQSRAMLEILEVRTLEEVEDILASARHAERETAVLEARIAEVEAEMAATRIQQENKSANNE